MLTSMFKRLITLVLFFYLSGATIFAQGEMSTKFIGDRFNVYNGQVNYKVWSLAEFFVANASIFHLSAQEQLSLRSCSETTFSKQYLFEEESYWVEETIRKVSLTDSLNRALKKEIKMVTTMLSQNLSDSRLNLYKDVNFVEPLFQDEVDTNDLKFCSKVALKEVWYYDKVNNRLKSDIVGLGLEVKNRMIWLYYPKLKSRYKYEFPKNELGKLLKNPRFIYDSQKFLESVKKSSDFKILVLEAMHLPLQEFKPGKGLETVINKVLKTGELLKFTYVNEYLSGEYIWKYTSGNIRERGRFNSGLRNGEVRSFYETGEVKFIKNYKDGFMDGKQQEFAKDGKLIQVYHFFNKILNGLFLLNKDQTVVRGQFENGLCAGLWNYQITLPVFWKIILERNKKYFNDHYKFESSWDSKVLLADLLIFSADYKYFNGSNCLNSKCLSVVIK